MSPYAKQTWTDNVTPVDKAHMDYIETGIATVESGLTTAKQNAISYGASPPGSPADGDLWCLPVDATNGVMWMFRYRAAAGTYKWEFVGGPRVTNEVPAPELSNSGTYVPMATAGPTITLPRAGDYLVEIGCIFGTTSTGTGNMSFDIGATAASDTDALVGACPASTISSGARLMRKSGLTAVALTCKYRSSAGNLSFGARFMAVTPVRVS